MKASILYIVFKKYVAYFVFKKYMCSEKIFHKGKAPSKVEIEIL